MNSRERVLAALRLETPDRTPFDFALGFSPYQLAQFRERTGADDPHEYFGADIRGVRIGPTRLRTDFSAYVGELPPGAYTDEWGQAHIPTQSEDLYHAHLEGYIYPMRNLSTEQDAWDYPLPDIEAAYRYEKLPAQIRGYHGRGLAVVAHMQTTIFEVAWYMRGMEALLIDFLEDSPFAAALLDRITAKRAEQARRYAELGPDVIMLGDDVGTQRGLLMSARLWRKWLKPRLAQVIAAARAANPEVLIAYHTDGDVTPLVPEFIEIGVQVLNPIQPECMDPFALKAEYGNRLAFWGTLGTQSTLPFGAPDDVRRDIEQRIESVGKGGGLLLAPTHMVEPEVPWENILAYVDTVKTYIPSWRARRPHD
jgi:uroporphyrinogen decarboxylase